MGILEYSVTVLISIFNLLPKIIKTKLGIYLLFGSFAKNS